MEAYMRSVDQTEIDNLFFSTALPGALTGEAQVDQEDIMNGNLETYLQLLENAQQSTLSGQPGGSLVSAISSGIPSGVSTPFDMNETRENTLFAPDLLESTLETIASASNQSNIPEPFEPDVVSRILENESSPYDTEPEVSVDSYVATPSAEMEANDYEFTITAPEETHSQVSSSFPSGTSTPRVDLLSLPPNIREIRQQLFEPTDKIRYSPDVFEQYWKFCDNVWTPTCPATAKKLILADGTVVWKRAVPEKHNHDISKADANRRPSILKDIAKEETRRGYSPAAIYRSMTGSDGRFVAVEKAIEALGGNYFTRQDVANAAKTYRKQFPDPRRVGRDFLPWLQMKQVFDHLNDLSGENETWYSKILHTTREIDQESSDGIVFTNKSQLETLFRHGFLVQMDATHKTNWLGWLLYTIMVRDDCSSWIPVAHFLTEKADGDIVMEALQTIRSWVEKTFSTPWGIRYFLTDDSAVEQKAVKGAFTPEDGYNVDLLLCSVHAGRTLKRKLSSSRYQTCLEHMLAALKFRRTETGCDESIELALQSLQAQGDMKMMEYIIENWKERKPMWANYAREVSPLLMQINSTNALEGYHSAIKYNNKSALSQYSLVGTTKHILVVDKRYMSRATKTREDFRSRTFREIALIPGLEMFPYPVQELLLPEIRYGLTMSDEGQIPSAYLFEGITHHLEENLPADALQDRGDFEWEVAHCDCRFYRQWRFPCRHIFHHHFVNASRTLSPARLRYWQNIWQQQGFELYAVVHERETTTNTVEDSYNERNRAMRRLRAREVTETILQSFYELERTAHAQLGAIEGSQFIQWYLERLQRLATEAGHVDFDIWRGSH
ncbi:hypothetical protein GGR50DRAFT_693366 [Xylaria sp. CBS 124048]|nr:hypothetical protein GGR50DRAFT_693366 [Xylaria sp. CBS 124048]